MLSKEHLDSISRVQIPLEGGRGDGGGAAAVLVIIVGSFTFYC
jgi:hypothetical protein